MTKAPAKKFFAVLLSLVMTLAVFSPGFASEGLPGNDIYHYIADDMVYDIEENVPYNETFENEDENALGEPSESELPGELPDEQDFAPAGFAAIMSNSATATDLITLRDAINNALPGVPTTIEITQEINGLVDDFFTIITIPAGKDIILTGGGTLDEITIENHGELTMQNITIKSPSIFHAIENHGTFIMESGVIDSTDSVGVVNEQGALFNMSGGNITGRVNNGAPFGVDNKGTFTMTGGTIESKDFPDDFWGNMMLPANGAGVNNWNYFTMSGGTISGNNVGVVNSALSGSIATFNMSGSAVITGNLWGGGVFNMETGRFIMNGGEITNNGRYWAVSGEPTGGGVNNSGQFIMNGGRIEGNIAGAGSGVYNVFVNKKV